MGLVTGLKTDAVGGIPGLSHRVLLGLGLDPETPELGWTLHLLTSPWALVVEENAVDGEEIIGLSEVHHDPVGIELGCSCGERG